MRAFLIFFLLFGVRAFSTQGSFDCKNILSILPRPVIPGISVPFDEIGAIHRNQRFLRISVQYDFQLRTAFYTSSSSSNDIRVSIPLLHGIGGLHSHSGAMFTLLNIRIHSLMPV